MKPQRMLHVLAMSIAAVSIAAPKKEPMNVLFLAVDDLKPMLGCYGNERVKSPHIDRLADGGTVFLNNHCQWPVCGPSRASIASGLMPEETGVMGFKAMRGKLTNLVTLPEHFRNQGYETAATGKINDPRCVGTLNPKNPTARTKDGRDIDDPASWSIPYVHASGIYNSPTKRSCESPDLPDDQFSDGAVCNEGLALLEQLAQGDKPFFLGIGFYKPHVPWYAPKKYWDLYERTEFPLEEFQELPKGGSLGAWKKGTEVHGYPDTPNAYPSPETGEMVYPRIPDDKQRELIHSYYACVSFIDAQVGRILAKLDELGLADNTIIVLWGDHGYHLGDHGQWGKHTLMEGATRSPLIIKAPQLGEQVPETRSPSGHIDMYRTLCELTRLEVPKQPKSKKAKDGHTVKGVSLVPVMTGEQKSVRKGILTHKGGYAFRTERYRYIEFVKGGKVLARDLYDYETDPKETVNLADEKKYAAIVKELAQAMRESPEAAGCYELMGK
ncbi:sulfatase [Pontiella sulfatireligans]|uniref:Choline-sulfatase n=1 Tax=Pontiella sulfatireligans TaxID=2750658 RepID=A0A6C2UQV1_9BACT|nr:sulfatase [Pontiella sulfatireligans]SPS74521.1 sulfatase S1_7 [Kiritimatiellales bacterium]VGO22598.1 Choline-sulfatase [Pontiella sulfatireligans]